MTHQTNSSSIGSAIKLLSIGAILALSSLGCFRSSGTTRPTNVSNEIPATGGEPIKGIKASSGPGDFYLGNDYIAVSVDGAKFGQLNGQFHNPARNVFALSGGAILDLSSIKLDTSYKRTNPNDDMVERLAPVINQDPALPLVFSTFAPSTTSDFLILDMTGKVSDPTQKLTGITRDSQNCIVGVAVTHQAKLGFRDRHITLTTTIKNNNTISMPIRNIADYLSQSGGGFKILAPAFGSFALDSLGQPLTQVTNWGANIPTPSQTNGTNFGSPLTSSVRAPYVMFLGQEPSDEVLDNHTSVGILSASHDQVLVSSDPQDTLANPRPSFPARVVVGSKEISVLAPGASLVYTRRVYLVSGNSESAETPSESTELQNKLQVDRGLLHGIDIGLIQFSTFGSAQRNANLVPEIRLERFTGSTKSGSTIKTDTQILSETSNWKLERIDLIESHDFDSGQGVTNSARAIVPVVNDPNRTGQTMPYRITIKNSEMSDTKVRFSNVNDLVNPNVRRWLEPKLPSSTINTEFIIGESLAPERPLIVNSDDLVVNAFVTNHTFSIQEFGTSSLTSFVPGMLIFAGLDSSGAMDITKDPFTKRLRKNGAFYDLSQKNISLSSTGLGTFQFASGNSAFGTSFRDGAAPHVGFFKSGIYDVYALHGPLSIPDTRRFSAFLGNEFTNHPLSIKLQKLPTGWTVFDLPGPTQKTSGGMTPAEQLSSGIANGVVVFGRTELDQFEDPTELRKGFYQQFDNPAVDATLRTPLGVAPVIIGARTGFTTDGPISGLFTPIPNNTQFGGAKPSNAWTVADFINQGQQEYTIIHRPRGSNGLFTLKGGIAAGVPLGSGTNTWWAITSSLSGSKTLGDFDAIELLRGDSFDVNNPSVWWNEFLALRQDWYNLLGKQTPTKFTKALGLSSANFSFNTMVGAARTYLQVTDASTLIQGPLTNVLTALRNGNAIASTGPLVIPKIGSIGPGGLVSTGAVISNVSVDLEMYAPEWVPLQEVRIILNGSVVATLAKSTFTQDANDNRRFTKTVVVSMATVPSGKGAWLTVEAGVPLNTSGAYAPNTLWSRYAKGLYPVSISNPIFINVAGSGYTHPLP